MLKYDITEMAIVLDIYQIANCINEVCVDELTRFESLRIAVEIFKMEYGGIGDCLKEIRDELKQIKESCGVDTEALYNVSMSMHNLGRSFEEIVVPVRELSNSIDMMKGHIEKLSDIQEKRYNND